MVNDTFITRRGYLAGRKLLITLSSSDEYAPLNYNFVTVT